MTVLDEAIKVLNENSFSAEAQTLEELGEALKSGAPEERAATVEELRGLCQVRAFGDLNITTMNGWKWNSLLEEVVAYADGMLTN